MNLAKALRLGGAIIICQLAGIIGSLFTTPAIPIWFASLAKPWFNPPSWLFGPVWITLYLLMGISLFMVWEKRTKKASHKTALTFFAVQLFLNSIWSILFFGLKSPLLAFIGIVLLWAAIYLTIIKFYKISKAASLLMIPYIVWVSFAAILNFAIWLLN